MKYFSALIVLITGFQAFAAPPVTAKEGLEKIRMNLENAKKNKIEYDKNLERVIANVTEVQKVKDSTLLQKKTVDSEISRNNDSLKKVSAQEKDINSYLTKEKDKLTAEDKQVEQLQKMILQVKSNQDQRRQIIDNYQNQMNAVLNNKKAWKERENQLKAQGDKTAQALRSISSEESNWVKKKKKYETEAKRWASESEKQQKIHDAYKGLAEGN